MSLPDVKTRLVASEDRETLNSGEKKREHDLYWSSFLLACGLVTPSVSLWTAAASLNVLDFSSQDAQWLLALFFVAALVTGLLSSLFPTKDRGQSRVTLGLSAFLFVALLFPIAESFLGGQERSPLAIFAAVVIVLALGVGHALTIGCLVGAAMSVPATSQLGAQRGVGCSLLVTAALRAFTEGILGGDGTNQLRCTGYMMLLESTLLSMGCVLGHGVLYSDVEWQGPSEIDEEAPVLESSTKKEKSFFGAIDINQAKRAVNAVGLEILNAFLIAFVTLAVYSGLYTTIPYMVAAWQRVLLVLLFASGEWTGRQVPKAFITDRADVTTAIVLLRALFIPVTYTALHRNAVSGPIALLLGLTQGYGLLCVFSRGQMKLVEQKEAFQGGHLLVIALDMGVALGTSAMLAWTSF